MRRLLIAGLLGLLLAGCNLAAGTLTPTSVPDIPIIRFEFPENGTSVAEGTDMQIQLVAEDSLGDGVSRVELFVDDLPHQQGSPVVSSAVPIFTVDMNWLARGIGLHSMSAVAYRSDGTASDPTTIRVFVTLEEMTTETP
jgi:hypothetical protein